MKLKNSIYLIILFIIVARCVPQSDYDELSAENERLKTELDDCMNGAERLIAAVEKAYAEKDYSLAKENIKALSELHPQSPKNAEFQALLKSIEKRELAEKKKAEAEEKERVKLANLNNTGMWLIGHYVDDFGEPTKQAYIRNRNLIRGTFSNTATQDSELDVKFLISNSNDISIQLYEYAGNNPVKAYSSYSYKVLIQDKDGKRYNLRATNYSERLSFDKSASWQVHSVLMKGGTVKFKIVESDTPTTIYEFTIQNADYYENAHRMRKES